MDVNKLWSEADLLLYTPTVGQELTSTCHTLMSCLLCCQVDLVLLEMMSRVRQFTSNKVTVFTNKFRLRKGASLFYTFDGVKKVKCNQDNSFKKMFETAKIDYEFDCFGRWFCCQVING